MNISSCVFFRAGAMLALAGGSVGFAQGSATSGDAVRGKVYFAQNCALCHPTGAAGEGAGRGPDLRGVVGRKAASSHFNYTQALSESKLTWDVATLDRFLTNPSAMVPGTTMPTTVPRAGDRADVVAYLATLPAGPAAIESTSDNPALTAHAPKSDAGDWRHAQPGTSHLIRADALPEPYSTASAGNGPRVVRPNDDSRVAVPPGFTAKRFVAGLTNPRLTRVAPNGDIFVAETAANRIRVLRAADGAEAPEENMVFAEGLDRPFGIAFYPAGTRPQWIYVANNNSVVRFAYQNGDLQARGKPEVIVPQLTTSRGGHSTRDVAFSLDGKRMFISVGSGSNVGEKLEPKSSAEILAWEKAHGLGAAWGYEENRADILVTDPAGRAPLHAFATGIRNGVGLAVDPATGELWTSTNERDGLGDDLVPDYITRVREGGYYGWPWYYLGNHEDPRHKGERPDLAGKAIVPDVLVQAHSASLQMTFYTATSGSALFPAEYRGDIFAALHGSWNRATRTGYKVIRVHLDHGVPTGAYEDFLTGLVVDDGHVWGRPVGVAAAHDGALLVTEDGNGTIWRVTYGKP